MKLITKTLLIVISLTILFLLTFKLILFKRVTKSFIYTTNKINFGIYKSIADFINNSANNINNSEKLRVLLSHKNIILKDYFHLFIEKNGNILTKKQGKIISLQTFTYPLSKLKKFINNLKKEGKNYKIFEDESCFIYLYKIKNLGYLIIGTSKNKLKNLLFSNLNYVIFTNITIIFLFFISIGLILIALINKEIKKLYSGISEINKGNLNYKFSETGSKEFVEVYKTINKITVQLKENIVQLQNEIKTSEQYFEISEAIMLVLDKNGNIAKINKKGAEILGYKKEELIGKNWFQNFIPEKYREKAFSIFNEIITGKVEIVKYFINKIITKNGERLISWHNSIIKDEKENTIYILSSGFDITDMKKLEKEQLKVMKLESIGILAGGIAHDFNNLLTGIFGNINIAKIKLEKNHPAFKYLERAHNSLERATSLTKQLLTFAKGGEPIIEEHSIVDIIKETTDFILSGSSIKCEYYFQKNLPPVKIDKGQISQVIQNILINAKEALKKENGVIKIYCENIFFEPLKNNFPTVLSKEQKYVLIKIQDNGIGIPKKFIHKIFDPYFTTKVDGNGLGLAICYSIIKKHNGHIEVESEEGKGTTFKIYIPAIQKYHKTSLKAEKIFKQSNNLKKLNILVVDDQEEILEVYNEFFKIMGLTTIVFKNGNKFLNFYKEAIKANKKYDLLILDLTIPGSIGGKEIAKEVLKLNPNAKIVVSSGYSNDPVIANYKKYGFSGYIIKPFTYDDLEQLIINLFSKENL